MAKILKKTLFGNPILREQARRLSQTEIVSPETQAFIADMFYTLESKKYGVGLAAPQVGQGIALCVVWTRPLPYRPNVAERKLVVINPEIVKTYGSRTRQWEGCMSFGTGSRDFPYAQTLRWRRVRVHYTDERGERHEENFDGLTAHVLQHEIDHLNGILFVEHVQDPKSFIMKSEFVKRILPLERKKRAGST